MRGGSRLDLRRSSAYLEMTCTVKVSDIKRAACLDVIMTTPLFFRVSPIISAGCAKTLTIFILQCPRS